MADASPVPRDPYDLRFRYCQHFDRGDVPAWLELFAADATLTIADDGPAESRGRYRGHGELRDLLERAREEREFMRHAAYNPVLERDGAGARGRWQFEALLAYPDGRTRRLYGHYDERYEPIDGTWRFTAVQVTPEHALEVAP